MKHTYSIGLDFGTLAGRAVMLDNATGQEIAVAVYEYPDAVISSALPGTGERLPSGFALQNPRDYQEACVSLLRDVRARAGVDAESIVGVGVDATASTVLALDAQGLPLCYREEYRRNPHSWPKLWKHHSAQPQADRINRLAREREEPFLRHCGGKVSAEWYWPKVLETIEEAPDVFDAAESFVELGDWIVYLLTSRMARSSAIASVHAQWDAQAGYPSEDYLRAVHPKLALARQKALRAPVAPIFTRAGALTREMAERTGLREGVAVGVADTDSPIALLSLGVTGEDTAALILGTSGVLLLLSREKRYVPGAMACAKDQMTPGFYGNMFGQSAVGDTLEWFVTNLVPHRYYAEAERNGETVFDVMNRRMEALSPNKGGLLALDWLNGNRSPLQNADLSGLIVGLSLSTKAEQIYRALVEAMAFGLKTIVDGAARAGTPIRRLCACGGLPRKSPAIMQIYADILELPIDTVASKQAVGCGSAILGALAAGAAWGGYDAVEDAVRAMQCRRAAAYLPRAEYAPAYRRLYGRYAQLCSYFGEERGDLMPELRKAGEGHGFR